MKLASSIAHSMQSVTSLASLAGVTRRAGGATTRWPSDNKTYRGTALPQRHRAFFTPGRQYRAPMFVATSFDEGVATHFLARLDPASDEQQPPHQEPCLWTFHFDGSLPEARRSNLLPCLEVVVRIPTPLPERSSLPRGCSGGSEKRNLLNRPHTHTHTHTQESWTLSA